MIYGLDHVAIGTSRFDDQLDVFCNSFGMTVRRLGTSFATGGRIAMIADQTSLRLELVETPSAEMRLMHLAYRVDDVIAERARLMEVGWTPISGPHSLEAAQAISASLSDPGGSPIQIISYLPGSPDHAGDQC